MSENCESKIERSTYLNGLDEEVSRITETKTVQLFNSPVRIVTETDDLEGSCDTDERIEFLDPWNSVVMIKGRLFIPYSASRDSIAGRYEDDNYKGEWLDEKVAEMIRSRDAEIGEHIMYTFEGEYSVYFNDFHRDVELSKGNPSFGSSHEENICSTYPLSDILEKFGIEFTDDIYEWLSEL